MANLSAALPFVLGRSLTVSWANSCISTQIPTFKRWCPLRAVIGSHDQQSNKERPMPTPHKGNIHDFFEQKAREGDSGFAIAYALLELTGQQFKTNQQLERIGLGDAYSGGKGALELIGMSLEKIASSISDVWGAISESLASSSE
jgi:hypothetical protein